MLSIFTNLHGSQTARGTGGRLLGFRDLQTYMVLKPLNRKFPMLSGFRDLQTYMVLKLHQRMHLLTPSFRSLQTYMVLKPNLKFKNFTVLTELLHTNICCKPIFLIPRCLFYHLKLNQAILLIQYMIIFTVQPFFL